MCGDTEVPLDREISSTDTQFLTTEVACPRGPFGSNCSPDTKAPSNRYNGRTAAKRKDEETRRRVDNRTGWNRLVNRQKKDPEWM